MGASYWPSAAPGPSGVRGGPCCDACRLSFPSSNGANGPGRYENLPPCPPPLVPAPSGEGPSRTSLNMRPSAFSGFEMLSPVFCSSRRASSPSEGAGSASGCAASSPVCEDGVEGKRADAGSPTGPGAGLLRGVMGRSDSSSESRSGDCGLDAGRDWMAVSTLL